MISDAQVEFYKLNGYVVVENVLPAEQLATLRREVEDLVAQSAAVTENNDIYDLEDTHTPQQPRVRRIKNPHAHLPSVAELVRDPKLVGILTRLMGPGVRFQVSKLNMKSAGFGAPVEWHQDWAFYPHTNQNLLATGIMLDDVDEDNGPLMVVPGSHKGPVYDHHFNGYFCGAIDPANCDLDFSKAAMLTGRAGSMTFHHVRAVHGSALNRSAKQRRLLLFQFTAVDAWPLVEPVNDIKEYDALIVAGEPTLTPRLEPVPVRLPLPPAPHQGSIYENQRDLGHRFFQHYYDDTHRDETQGVGV